MLDQGALVQEKNHDLDPVSDDDEKNKLLTEDSEDDLQYVRSVRSICEGDYSHASFPGYKVTIGHTQDMLHAMTRYHPHYQRNTGCKNIKFGLYIS